MTRPAQLNIYPSSVVIAALLCACTAQDAAPPAHTGGVATVAPTSGQLAGGIGVALLRLDQRDTSPGLCDAAVYGSIAAASGEGLCICQPQPDRQHGDWVQAITKQPCWAGSQ